MRERERESKEIIYNISIALIVHDMALHWCCSHGFYKRWVIRIPYARVHDCLEKYVLYPFKTCLRCKQKKIEEIKFHGLLHRRACHSNDPSNKRSVVAAEIVEGCAGSQVQQISSTDPLSLNRENCAVLYHFFSFNTVFIPRHFCIS